MTSFLRHGKDRGKPPPDGFQILEIEYDECRVELNVKASHEQMLAPPGQWNIDTTKDLRIPAFVSLVKAAHLSMFSMLGYRYVLSNAGQFVGQDILGKFYRQNRHLRLKREVQQRALPFFKPYRHMLRPMMLDSTTMEGTLTDGIVNLFASTNDLPWGMTIFVRTGEFRNAVRLPFPEGADSIATFMGFLENDHEQIHVMYGIYEPDQARWKFEKERRWFIGPKGSIHTHAASSRPTPHDCVFLLRGEDSSACQRLNGDSRELQQTHLSRQTRWWP